MVVDLAEREYYFGFAPDSVNDMDTEVSTVTSGMRRATPSTGTGCVSEEN